ncbi:unnamed protein product, partial [Schistosoma haematobium]
MRYNFSSGLSITLCFIAVLFYEFFDCQDICQQPQLKDYKKVVYENGSYLYSHHYNYSMRVRLDQPNPLVNCSLKKFSLNEIVTPKFSFKYYDSDVHVFDVFSDGYILMRSGIYLGQFSIFTSDNFDREFEVLERDELFAARWFYKVDNVTHTITGLIHPSRKISIYYEDIPTQITKSVLQPEFLGSFQCETNETRHEIFVDPKWIRSGTLLEFEAIGTTCAKYNSTKACQSASTSNVTCIWCEKANTCIESNDQNTHQLKVNDCRVENSTDVNDLSTATPIKHIETTLGITEIQVSEKLKETTGDTYQYS